MADQTERIIIEIDGSSVKGEAQQVERAINTIGDAADKAGKKVDTAEKSINELGGALKTTGSSAKTTERDFQSLQSTIGNARPAQAQADALKQVANSAKQSASEMSNLGRTAGGGVGQIRGITSAATPAATAMSSLSGAAGLLVRTLPLVGGAVAAINLTGLISQSTQLAARYETLGVVMNVVGKNAGYTSTEMERFDRSLQKTGISMAESRNNLAKMASANIDLANASKLARIAQDAAVIGNMNSSQAFQSLIYGIQSAQVEVLRTIGLNVNFEQSYKKLADQLGKTSNELTETEKTQARLNAVMEKAPSIAGAYEASLDTVGKKLGSAERLAENAKTMLGALFLPTWTAAVDAYSEALVRVNEELEDIDVGKAELLGRAFARIFTAPDASSTTLTGFAFNLWQNYEDAAEAANVTVKKSFFDTWAEIEKAGMNQSNRFIEVQAGQAAEVERANAETLESFRRASQTQRQKLDDDYARFIKAADGNAQKIAEINAWYESEVGKLAERETKKRSTELKKQVSEAKKAREEMLKGGKDAEQAIEDWQEKYDKRRIDAIAESTAKTVKMRVDAEKEAADAARKIAEEQESAAQKVMDRIQEGTADVFYDMFQDIGKGWETLWTSMKNWALRTLAELAARAATVQIVVPIMTSMTGTTNATQAVQSLTGGNGGFNLSSLSSLVNPGSMLSNVPGYSTVAGILGTQLPGTTLMSGGALSLAAGGTAGGSVASLAAAQNLAGMTGGLSIGSALGMGGIGGLGYSLLGGSLGLPQNQYSGITSSLGGALGAWGGSALASSTAGAALGATVGSALPVVGTVAGALLGGLGSSLFGGKKGTPRVSVTANTIEWGQAEVRAVGRSGMKKEGVRAVEESLEAYLAQQFAAVDAALAGLGDKYLDMVQGQTITFGRGTPGNEIDWHWSHKQDDTAKAQEVLRKKIYEAASGAFTAAGQDIASGDDATKALSMLAEKSAAQFRSLQDALAAGVQSGNVEAYIAQLQSFQATVQAITATWDAVNAAADDLVKPPTAYESAVRQANAQFDGWLATMDSMGFAEDRVREIEEKRIQALMRLNMEMGPLAEAEASAVAARNKAEVDALGVLNTARENLMDAYQRESAELQKVISTWSAFADSLKSWRDNFMSSDNLPTQARSIFAQRNWDMTYKKALVGDQEAVGGLTQVADEQLLVARMTAETQEDYLRTAFKTYNAIGDVENLAARHVAIAENQLKALQYEMQFAQAEYYEIVNQGKTTMTMKDALVELKNAYLNYQSIVTKNKEETAASAATPLWTEAGYLAANPDVAAAVAIGDFISGMQHWLMYGQYESRTWYDSIQQRASGGYTHPGLTLVGEEGPELVNFNRPSIVYDAQQTRELLTGGRSNGTSSEIRALRDDLRSIGRALAKNTLDTAKLLKRWDGDGMPEERVVA